jgi:hypothetical protein
LVLVTNLFGQSQIAKEMEHPDVFWKNQGIEGSDATSARVVDQTLGEREAQAVSLPAIGDDRGILGASSLGFAIVTDNRNDLPWITWIEGDEREAVALIQMSEVVRLPFTQMR